MNVHALTIDVEDWYQTNGLNLPISSWEQYEDRVVTNTRKILQLLSEYNVKGTFFILGCVAEKFPHLVKEIDELGHEIGSHGGWHQLLYTLTLDEFREDLRYSKRVLEGITGKEVTFYRAPSWSITKDRYGVFEILQEEGFICDSSLQPFSTPLSGIAGSPVEPFYPIVEGKELQILEFPPTVFDIAGMRIPFAGGFYFRAVPFPLVTRGLRHVSKKRSGMVYLHPWEFDPKQPRLKASPLIKLAQYWNLCRTEEKFRKLLSAHPFAPMGEVILQGKFSSIPLTS